jgi:hypothetical protein
MIGEKKITIKKGPKFIKKLNYKGWNWKTNWKQNI